MKVICKGFNICEHKDKCHHSKPHDIKGWTCNCLNDLPNCDCVKISDIRKEKLKKLNNERNL